MRVPFRRFAAIVIAASVLATVVPAVSPQATNAADRYCGFSYSNVQKVFNSAGNPYLRTWASLHCSQNMNDIRIESEIWMWTSSGWVRVARKHGQVWRESDYWNAYANSGVCAGTKHYYARHKYHWSVWSTASYNYHSNWYYTQPQKITC